MKLLMYLCFLVALSFNGGKEMIDNTENDITVHIEIAKNEFKQNDKVVVKFSVINNSRKSIKFCYWQTPLEKKLTANCFEIEYNGRIIPYNGIMMKRSAPKSNDYIKLKPNKTISQEIELNDAYDLSKKGKYKIKFLGRTINNLPNSKSLTFTIV